MVPWFKNFLGTIESLGDQRYVINGELSEISDTKIEITELPVRTWTQTYKEQVNYLSEPLIFQISRLNMKFYNALFN